MKIIFNESVVGKNYEYHADEEHDVPEAMARRYVRSGAARMAGAAPEAAVVEPAENAAQPRARRRNLRNLGGLLPR